MTFYTAQARGRRPKRMPKGPKAVQSAAPGSEDDDWLPLALEDEWCSCGDSDDEWVLMTF